MRSRSKSFAPATAIFAVFLFVASVQFTAKAEAAESLCDQRDRIGEILREQYKEIPVALGVTTEGALIEVLSTDSGNTWSIIVTTSRGISCVIAAGEGWRSKADTLIGPEA